MTTLWVLLHVAAQRDYELHSLDFSTAFLQGCLHEEIWLRCPPGFIGSFPAGTQWSLRRPVYSLRQAPREWHDTLRTTLAALGFAPSTADPSLFLRTDTTLPPFYVLVYVDDLVFAIADTEALAHVKSELQKRHTCIDLGELTRYLGLQITWDRAQRTITLTQSHMVQQVLQRFGFTYSSPQSTPLPTGHSLSAPPSDECVEPSGPYPELVGYLMYMMTCTRPDLAYPLSLLAHYVAPGRHRKRSSQGYTFSLGSEPVSWRSTHSSSVLSSRSESEIYAGAMAAQELCWLTYLLTDLVEVPCSPPVLNWSERQDARNDTRPAQGHQPPLRNLNPTVQHQQQQPQTAPVRNVMCNMTMTSGSHRPRARSPSPEPARHPIRAFLNNYLFSMRHDFTDDNEHDGICRDCHTPFTSTSAIVGRDLATIAEAERQAPPEEGLSHMELKIATHAVFGTEEHPLPGTASQHLRGMLRGVGVRTFDAHEFPLPRRKKRNWRDAKRKSFANGALRRRAAHSPGADGAKSKKGEAKEDSRGEQYSGGKRGNKGGKRCGGKCWYCHVEGHPWFKCRKLPDGRRPGQPSIEGSKGVHGAMGEDMGSEEGDGGAGGHGGMFYHVGEACSDAMVVPASKVALHRSSHWVINTIAFMTMTNREDLLDEVRPSKAATVVSTTGQVVPVRGEGRAMFMGADGRLVGLKRVLLVLGLCANLLSTKALSEAGMKMEMMGTKVFKATLDERVFVTPSMGEMDWLTTHRRFGHVALPQLQQLFKEERVKELRIKGEPKDVGSCETCLTSKFSRFPFHSAVGQSSDPVGPMKVKGDGGALYSMTMVDEYTRLTWSFPLAKKSGAARVIIEEWLPMVERESGKWVKAIRSDRGGEFLGAEFRSWLKRHGIKQQLTTAYTPQSNGVAERANRAIIEGGRTILVDSGLPLRFWPLAIPHATIIKNRVLTHVGGQHWVPMEKWSGKKPLVDMLRVFGCMGLVYVPKEKHEKLQAAEVWAVHLGLARGSKGWLMWDPKSNTIFTTKDAKFMEGLMFKEWSEWGRSKVTIPLGIEVGTNDPLLIPIELSSSSELTEVSHDLGGAKGEAADVEGVLQQGEAPVAERGDTEEEVQQPTPSPKLPPRRTTQGLCDDVRGGAKDEGAKERPKRAAHPRDFLKYERLGGPKALLVQEEEDEERGAEGEKEQICCFGLNLPLESDSMEEALGRKALDCTWVLRVKTDAVGELERRKTWLVMKGFQQREGIDFQEVFAPVSKAPTLRVLVAAAAVCGWKVEQMDVKTAFLCCVVDEEIYMKQPEGYDDVSGRVCMLNKAIYGLKQAPRYWYARLVEALEALGFKVSGCDESLFTTEGEEAKVFLLVYVDDILLFSPSLERIKEVQRNLKETFQCKALGPVGYYLGLHVERDEVKGWLRLHQHKYLAAMGEKYGLEEGRSVKTPLPSGFQLHLDEEEGEVLEYELQRWFQSMAVSWASATPKWTLDYNMKGGGEALANGARATLSDGEPQLAATPADGALHLAARQAGGALPAKAGGLFPGSDLWDTIDWDNEPSTPRRTIYGSAPEPREPTFFPRTIPGTNIPLSTILDREFLTLMPTTANGDDEAEETTAEPAQAPDEDRAEAHVRYMRTSGFHVDDTIWHQRLGHPSRVTLKNCIEVGVFAPGALLRPDGTEVGGATHPRNCTVCPEAALSHHPSPVLEPETNRYAKLEKVYSDFLNVGDCGMNDELYTLTFVDIGTRYVWIVNVEARSRAYEVFRLWLAHAQRQSGEKLKIWQSDGAVEFRRK
ncbi:unnamed protein product [Closterium sp. NIES-54]